MHHKNSEKYDFPENDIIKGSYIICSVPRSGSTLLCRGLWDSGIAGAPKEYFHHKHIEDFYSRWHFKDSFEYIELLKKYRTSPNGIFGFKAHFDQYCEINEGLDLRSVFPGLKYIFVSRKDHLKQAISLSKAIQTKKWSSEDKAERIPLYDYHDIQQKKELIQKQEKDWENFFSQSKIHCLKIIYEEFIDNYENTILASLDYLGIKISSDLRISPPKLKKIGDSTNDIWLEKFKEQEIANKHVSMSISSSTLNSATKSLLNQQQHTPKISVEMGCYNFEKYIAEAIESVLAQTLQPYELIISDDQSTDNSWEIIQYFARKYPNLIRAFRTPKNLGMKKCGIMRKDLVRGELISTIDGDDRWMPRKLELEWEALKKHPEAKLAYSNVYLINEYGGRISVWYDGNDEPPPSGDVFIQTFAKRFFKNNRSVFRNHLMYYDVLKEIGYKDLDDQLMHPDWDKKIRMTALYKVAYSGQALVEYRVHNNGIHKQKAGDLFKSTNYVIQKNMHLLKARSADEQQYVLENLKTLLIQDYNYGRKFSSISTKDRNNNDSQKNAGYRGGNIIFLISQPRSGSTLLQRILSGHLEIHTTAEPWLMLHPLYAIKTKGVFAEFDSNLARQGLEDFLSQVPEGLELYLKALRNMAGTLYHRVLEVSGKRFFLDKTPRYHFIVPELEKVFPAAKFIFLLRNPMAVLSSTLKTWFQNNPVSLQKSPNYLDVIKGPSNLIQGIQLLNDKAVVVRYEELVENAEITVKAICHKLGIGFQQAMLNYGTRPKPKGRFGDSVGIVKHHNAVPYYVDQWAENLQSPQLYDFSLKYMSALGPEIFNLMGYPYEENKSKLDKLAKQSRPIDEQTIETSNSLNETPSIHQAIEDQIKTLETILKQNPHAAQSHNDLGVLYYRLGEKEKVLFHYQEAVRLNPVNTIFAKNLADFYYVEMKNIEAALQIYNKVLQIAPNDTETLIILGLINEDLDRFEDAKNFYDRVLAIDPYNQQAHHHLNKLGLRDFENKLSARS